jgi:hypothetical protein
MSPTRMNRSSFRVSYGSCPTVPGPAWHSPCTYRSRGEVPAHSIQPLLGALTTCAHQCGVDAVHCAGLQVGTSGHTQAIHCHDGTPAKLGTAAADWEEMSDRPDRVSCKAEE